jgi:hypothetical protein
MSYAVKIYGGSGGIVATFFTAALNKGEWAIGWTFGVRFPAVVTVFYLLHIV